MSGFAPGDVVVCVDASPRRTINPGRPWPFRLGQALRVARVYPPDLSGFVGLRFTTGQRPIGEAYSSLRFRKIDPASDEFTQQMRALRPQKVGEPA